MYAKIQLADMYLLLHSIFIFWFLLGFPRASIEHIFSFYEYTTTAKTPIDWLIHYYNLIVVCDASVCWYICFASNNMKIWSWGHIIKSNLTQTSSNSDQLARISYKPLAQHETESTSEAQAADNAMQTSFTDNYDQFSSYEVCYSHYISIN